MDMFLVTPETVEERCDGRPQLFEIAWETAKGTYGPKTLVKECNHSTACCPECGSIGRYDENSEVCCVNEECGVVISGDHSPLFHETYDELNGHGTITAEPEADAQ